MKLNLDRDLAKFSRYVEQRFKQYNRYENLGPGDDDDVVSLITVGFYIEQTGYVSLVFDKRPDADSDGHWTSYLENAVNLQHFPKWHTAFKELVAGREIVVVADGQTHVLGDNHENQAVAKFFGDHLRDAFLSSLAKPWAKQVPFSRDALLVIEEFDGRYYWPPYSKRKSLGRILKHIK